jgi:hypothetical protein
MPLMNEPTDCTQPRARIDCAAIVRSTSGGVFLTVAKLRAASSISAESSAGLTSQANAGWVTSITGSSIPSSLAA